MSSLAIADEAQLNSNNDHTEPQSYGTGTMESNHELPARTMAEGEGDEQSLTNKEDPATMAASEELKHTTISDKSATTPRAESSGAHVEPVGQDKAMDDTGRANTPDSSPTDAQDEEMRERVASPKKKRGREQEDDAPEPENDADEAGSDGSVVNGSRTATSGPYKKRPRDTSQEVQKTVVVPEEVKASIAAIDTDKAALSDTDDNPAQSIPEVIPSTDNKDKLQTSPAAFANSTFASLASSASPFGSLGATKPSVFGGGSQPASGFGALAAAKTPTIPSTTNANGFGGTLGDKTNTGFGFGGAAPSGFGSLASGSVFGSKLGSGFAGGSGPKLSSFAAPGKENTIAGTKSVKAKAFGAPESDDEDNSDDDGSDEPIGSDEEEARDPARATAEEKKSKVAKVHIDDGEAGEATLLQVRARIYALDSKEVGWKERGVGSLKINVPQPCAGFDDNGLAIPGSFDASELENLEEGGPRAPRLILRQENTHRVILNTIIARGLKFEDKPGTTTAQMLFTGFEGEKEPKPVNFLLKMSEANGKLFRSEVESIQRGLAG